MSQGSVSISGDATVLRLGKIVIVSFVITPTARLESNTVIVLNWKSALPKPSIEGVVTGNLNFCGLMYSDRIQGNTTNTINSGNAFRIVAIYATA